jgi:hypothetical protein
VKRRAEATGRRLIKNQPRLVVFFFLPTHAISDLIIRSPLEWFERNLLRSSLRPSLLRGFRVFRLFISGSQSSDFAAPKESSGLNNAILSGEESTLTSTTQLVNFASKAFSMKSENFSSSSSPSDSDTNQSSKNKKSEEEIYVDRM